MSDINSLWDDQNNLRGGGFFGVTDSVVNNEVFALVQQRYWENPYFDFIMNMENFSDKQKQVVLGYVWDILKASKELDDESEQRLEEAIQSHIMGDNPEKYLSDVLNHLHRNPKSF